MKTVKTTKLTLIATATVAAIIALPAAAHADKSDYQFLAPSGNIACGQFTTTIVDGTKIGVFCDIRSYTWSECGGHGQRFVLSQEIAGAFYVCNTNSADPALPTLPYGQMRSVAGPFTCDSEPSGMTCTDSSTGHFFRVSGESYQLG
jgi:hypothetical protein